jgi:hypothetical protein
VDGKVQKLVSKEKAMQARKSKQVNDQGASYDAISESAQPLSDEFDAYAPLPENDYVIDLGEMTMVQYS